MTDSPKEHEMPPRRRYNRLCLDAYVSLLPVLCSFAPKLDHNRCSERIQLRGCTKGERGLWFGIHLASLFEALGTSAVQFPQSATFDSVYGEERSSV